MDVDEHEDEELKKLNEHFGMPLNVKLRDCPIKSHNPDQFQKFHCFEFPRVLTSQKDLDT